MQRLMTLALLLCHLGSPQVLVDSGRAAEILQQFNLQTGSSLQCEITPVTPATTFTFRFQTGYLVRLPLRQFRGPGHWITVLTRVTPRLGDREPVYLLRTFELPDVPETDFSANLAGVFLVGEGRYQANAIVFDDSHRVCRANWQIEVKRPERYRILIPPARVAPISDAAFWAPTTDASLDRLTIFLHAAPLNPRESRLQASDVAMAVASLTALLEKLPARSVRLVVFNLHQQKELYRSDFFTVNDLDQVTHALDGLQLGLVNYHALQSQKEHPELLRNLIHRELNEPSRSSDIILLGPDGSYSREDPIATAEKPAPGQHFFYLQYRMATIWAGEKQSASIIDDMGPRPPPPCQAVTTEGCNNSIPPATPHSPVAGSAPNTWKPSDPDPIASAVRKLKGKVFVVRNAEDFAKAVERISQH
jgi:hypothetical protein